MAFTQSESMLRYSSLYKPPRIDLQESGATNLFVRWNYLRTSANASCDMMKAFADLSPFLETEDGIASS